MLPPFDPTQEFRKGIRELIGSFSETASAAVWGTQLLYGSLWVWGLLSISFNKHIARKEFILLRKDVVGKD